MYDLISDNPTPGESAISTERLISADFDEEMSRDTVITIKSDDPLSPFKIVKVILKNGSVMAASYSYSFLLLIVTYMISQLKDNQGSNTVYMAGGTLAITVLDTCVVVSISSAFILGFFGKLIYKEIQTALPSENLQTESKVPMLNKNMSSLIKNGMILGAPFTAISMLFMALAKPILIGTGQDQDVVDLIQIPLLISSFSLPVYLTRFCIEKMLLAGNQPTFVTAVSLINLALFGVGLAYVLGFGLLGVPAMGITGIFIGMIAENVATFLTCMSGLRFKKAFKDFNFLRSFFTFNQDDREQLRQLGKVGVPLILTVCSEWLATTVRNILAGRVGTDELAAQINASQLFFLVFLLAMAFAEATGLLISGAGPHQQRDYAKYGLLTNAGVNGIITLAAALRPDVLTKLINQNASEQVVALGNKLVPYAAVNAFLYTLAIAMKQALIAKTFTWPSLRFNISIWTGVLSSFLLAFYADQGINGINQGAIIGTILGIFSLLRDYLEAFKAPLPEVKQDVGSTKAQQLAQSKKPRVSCCDSVTSFFSSCFNSLKRRVYPDPLVSSLTL